LYLFSFLLPFAWHFYPLVLPHLSVCMFSLSLFLIIISGLFAVTSLSVCTPKFHNIVISSCSHTGLGVCVCTICLSFRLLLLLLLLLLYSWTLFTVWLKTVQHSRKDTLCRLALMLSGKQVWTHILTLLERSLYYCVLIFST
jgi:hypothetical protein